MQNFKTWHIEAIRIGLTVVPLFVAVMWFASSMHEDIALTKQRVEYIESNHLSHIEADMDEIRQDMDELKDCFMDIRTALAQIEFINLE